MAADGLRHRAKDDARLRQLFLEGGDDGDAVEHGVDGHARAVLHPRQDLALLERDAELLVRAQELRIDFGEALGAFHRFRRRVVVDVLEVDLRMVHVGPRRLAHRLPAAVGLEPPFQHPGRLVLLLGDEGDDALVEALRRLDDLDGGLEAILVLIDVDPSDLIDRLLNCWHRALTLFSYCGLALVVALRRCSKPPRVRGAWPPWGPRCGPKPPGSVRRRARWRQ